MLGVSLLLAVIASFVDGFASDRVELGLLHEAHFTLLSHSIVYSFAVIAITLLSLSLIELAFRKSIHYIQYILIALALTLFYLLLLALTEKVGFIAGYIIVTAMTVTLITLFIKGITRSKKAVSLTLAILIAEYALLYLLVNLGSLALLIGSVLLFVLIALAMYFTLKLKVENGELVIK